MNVENLLTNYLYLPNGYKIAPGATVVVPDLDYAKDDILAAVINAAYAAESINVTSPPGEFPRTGVHTGTTLSEFDDASIQVIIDGGGSAIQAGYLTYVEVPFNCRIQSVKLAADVSGDIVIDIWVDTFANFPPTNADSITGGNEPELTNDQKYEDATLTSWDTVLSAGDWLAFNVDSAATVERVTVSLSVLRV